MIRPQPSSVAWVYIYLALYIAIFWVGLCLKGSEYLKEHDLYSEFKWWLLDAYLPLNKQLCVHI